MSFRSKGAYELLQETSERWPLGSFVEPTGPTSYWLDDPDDHIISVSVAKD